MTRRPLAIRTTSWLFALLWAWTIAASQVVRPTASDDRVGADTSADVRAVPALRTTIESQIAARHRAPTSAGQPASIAPSLFAFSVATHATTRLVSTTAYIGAPPRRLAFRYVATAPPAIL